MPLTLKMPRPFISVFKDLCFFLFFFNSNYNQKRNKGFPGGKGSPSESPEKLWCALKNDSNFKRT